MRRAQQVRIEAVMRAVSRRAASTAQRQNSSRAVQGQRWQGADTGKIARVSHAWPRSSRQRNQDQAEVRAGRPGGELRS